MRHKTSPLLRTCPCSTERLCTDSQAAGHMLLVTLHAVSPGCRAAGHRDSARFLPSPLLRRRLQPGQAAGDTRRLRSLEKLLLVVVALFFQKQRMKKRRGDEDTEEEEEDEEQEEGEEEEDGAFTVLHKFAADVFVRTTPPSALPLPARRDDGAAGGGAGRGGERGRQKERWGRKWGWGERRG
ncbi:unnamed protein product [Pleuronectes platessa]|uniref:Uncharacterized protein n=1 Tax=Pleuronectes platessa TaxID=8262 RepID=A0A9N7VRU3_PLEPL|nr:unnamed protein product [Pleuronectes platessa]